MDKKLHPVISVRVFNDQKCFGPGIAELLRCVDEHHSLRAAAKSMAMAYSKAWTIIKNSEKGLGISLIESSTGGKNGGGAVLTDEGRKILEAYERYCEKLREKADALFEEEFNGILR